MVKLKPISCISKNFNISKSVLYRHIKTDPTFPVINAGIKKKYVIDEMSLMAWLKSRSLNQPKLSGEEVLRRFS